MLRTKLPRAPRHLLRAGSVLLGLTVVTVVGVHGTAADWNAAAIDWRTYLLPERDSTEVAVVQITADDYDTLFGSTSPLDPDVLQRLLEAVAGGGARVIGLDVDTSDPRFMALSGAAGGPPIAWGSAVASCATLPAGTPCSQGRQVPAARGGTAPPDSTGIAMLPADEDGVLRYYTRAVPVSDVMRPGLPWLMIRYVCGRKAPPLDSRPRLIGYHASTALHVIDASHALELFEEDPARWTRGPLAGKFVLVGGTYPQSRDEARTPLGWKPGVMVLAHVLETELAGGGAVAPSPLSTTVYSFLAGAVLILLFHLLPFRRAAALSMLGVVALAPLISVLVSGSLDLLLYFLPLLALVLAQQLYDRATEYRDRLAFEVLGRSRRKHAEEPPFTGHTGSRRPWRALTPHRTRYRNQAAAGPGPDVP